jgi:transcriptional regulator with PAS, ATPase and Fis domain
MTKVLELVSKVARSDSAVLVLGESGTGKELIAAAIHRLSPRSHRSFIPLNCSAIPENLLESELFGHEKGAFTGADRRRQGHFEAANGGTIFLDEIGDMPPSLQAKLLRVLQDRRFTPLGGSESKEADVRVIAATNKNLEQAIKRGEFRLDLYYRLNVLPVYIPALRERSEDIPELLEFFVENANRVQTVTSPCFFTDELVRFLSTFQWPGNVRQLQNLVERLVVMKGGGSIGLGELPREVVEHIDADERREFSNNYQDTFEGEIPRIRRSASMPIPVGDRPVALPTMFGDLPTEGLDLVKFIEDLENGFIKQALERTGNNKNQAAKLLGLNRTTLVERIKKRRISPLNEPSKEL